MSGVGKVQEPGCGPCRNPTVVRRTANSVTIRIDTRRPDGRKVVELLRPQTVANNEVRVTGGRGMRIVP